MDNHQSYSRVLMQLEFAFVVRFGVCVLFIASLSALASWVFSVEDSAVWARVLTALLASGAWYIGLRQVFVCASAWETLHIEISHWSRDADVSRLVRLGVGRGVDKVVTSVVTPERVLPVKSGGQLSYRLLGGWDVRDLSYFVSRSFSLGQFGTSQRNWLDVKMPSGRVVESKECWQELQGVFDRAGVLVDVGVERKCARWLVHDADIVLETLNLPYLADVSAPVAVAVSDAV